MRREGQWRWGAVAVVAMVVSACVGLPPSPPEVAVGTTGTAGTASTSREETTESLTTRGSSPATGLDGDTTAEPTDGTTSAVQPDTSTSTTSEASSSSTSTGLNPGTTSTEGASSSGEAPPTCNELYGAAPGYLLCMETAFACQFLAVTNGDDCNTMCSLFGGTCLAAFDNSAGTCEVIEPNTDTCDTNRGDEICECSR